MIEPETIRDKPWFAQDDELHVPDKFDPEWDTVVWTTDSYIASGQIRSAFADPDVIVGDIEDGPEVRLLIQEDSSEQNWPTDRSRQLASLATERFRQYDHRPGWKDELALHMLYYAQDNVHDARQQFESGDELGAKEDMADALNYMLFALDTMEDE